MSGAGRVTVRVRYAETDQQGVAYHGHYLVWMEIGRTAFLRDLGYPYDRLEAEGLIFSVVEASCRYQAAARYDDEVEILTRCREVRSRAATFDYELKVEGRAIATGSTTLVALDVRRFPRRIPEEVAAALRGKAS